MDFMMRLDYLTKIGGGLHDSIMGRLTTGNIWVDTVVAAGIPIVMHFLLPAGAYNSFSGHLAIDVVLLASTPFFRTKWVSMHEELHASGASFFHRLSNTYETTIKFEKQTKTWYNAENDDEDSEEGKRNNILQKAILLYLGHLALDYRTSLALLAAVKPKPSEPDGNGRRSRFMEQQPKVYGGSAEQLESFNINISPPEAVWVHVDKKNGIWFKQTKKVEPIGGKDSNNMITTTKYIFQCAHPDGNIKVKIFIREAYEWYIREMRSTEDNARYMYSLVATPEPPKKGSGKDGHRSGGPDDSSEKKDQSASCPLRYRRYKLGDEKDFDSLFFPEKDKLLKILGNFEAKRGRYAIKGYPHKLGLLLHGPPGTGKTSLIKALACKTGRHIIQVPLGRVNTNQDLMNIMYDQSFPVVKQELAVPLKYENVIFVFEDVDAASKIVKARKNINHNTNSIPRGAAIAPAHGPHRSGVSLERNKSKSKKNDSKGRKSAGKIKTEATMTNNSGTLTTPDGPEPKSPCTSGDETTAADDTGMVVEGEREGTPVGGAKGTDEDVEGTRENGGGGGDMGESDSDDDDSSGSEEGDEDDSPSEEEDGGGEKSSSSKAAKKNKTKVKYASKYDKLDLSGLLNVLDGVVDTPNRIVVFTSNRLNYLDPALVRPGRIDQKILLGYLKYNAALDMTKHFFPLERDSLTDKQMKRLEAVFSDESVARRRRSGSIYGGDADGGELTPAMVEQILGEHDKVDDFLDALEEL